MQKNRYYIKKQARKILNTVQMKYESISLAKQIVIIGAILGILSMFFPWIIDKSTTTNSWNAFHSISGNIGYFLSSSFLVIIFLILSEGYKEKLKLYSDIDFKNYFIILFVGIISVLLGIVGVSFAVGLSFLSQNIHYGNGPILCIVSGILLCVSGILVRTESQKNSGEVILQQLSNSRKRKKEKANMELPF